MRSVYLFWFFLITCSCNENRYKEKELVTPAIVFAIKNFCNSNPEMFKNDILLERANKDFKNLIIPAIQKDILNDYIFELRSINEFGPGKFSAHFDMSYSNDEDFMNIDSAIVHGDLIGIIDSGMVSKLKDEAKYKIKGVFIKMLTLNEIQQYTQDYLWSPKIDFTKGAYLRPEISLGFILMKIIDIEHINRPKRQ